MSNQNDMKYLKKICRGLLLCSTGIVLTTTYNAYHTSKEYDLLHQVYFFRYSNSSQNILPIFQIFQEIQPLSIS